MHLRKCCQQREMSIRRQSGLTEAEVACLTALGPEEGLSVGELSARMGLSKSRGGRVIDRLVRRRLVDRRGHGDDRRVAEVVVTAAGRAVQQRLGECVDACEAALRQRLTRAEQRAAISGLALMITALEDR